MIFLRFLLITLIKLAFFSSNAQFEFKLSNSYNADIDVRFTDSYNADVDIRFVESEYQADFTVGFTNSKSDATVLLSKNSYNADLDVRIP